MTTKFQNIVWNEKDRVMDGLFRSYFEKVTVLANGNQETIGFYYWSLAGSIQGEIQF